MLWSDLVRRKDFEDVADRLDLPFSHVGFRLRGFYLDLVAVVEADGADRATIEAWCGAALRATRTAPGRLGLPRIPQPCMVLLLVFRNGCDPDMADFIRHQRLRILRGQGAVLVGWVVDLETGAVTPHRNPVSWFPPIVIAHDRAMGMAAYPGLDYLQRFVRWYLDLVKAEAGRWRILVVTASPATHPAVSEGREVRAIRKALEGGGSRFRLDHLPAATPDDLRWQLRWGRYRLVHLCCHGTPQGLYLCDADGEAHLLSGPDLNALVATCASTLECIYLNACHSSRVGQALHQTVPSVIAAEDEISDPLARRFASRFYAELVQTGSVVTSFEATVQTLAQEGVLPHRMPGRYGTE